MRLTIVLCTMLIVESINKDVYRSNLWFMLFLIILMGTQDIFDVLMRIRKDNKNDHA